MPDTRRYHVTTCSVSETVEAESPSEAARIAVTMAAVDAPVELGHMIEVRPEDDPEDAHFIVTAKIVQQLGLEVTT